MEPTLAVLIFTALRFLAVLGALIAVHEFGHFIVAKKSGVLVERFPLDLGRQSGARNGVTRNTAFR